MPITEAEDRKLVDVVAGIIFNERCSKVLLALRDAAQHQGNRWEFPGGKMEPGESQRLALTRELHEELGIDVLRAEHHDTLEYHYPDKSVRLHFWSVFEFAGTPEGREQQLTDWVAVADLGRLTFPDANRPIVRQLLERQQPRPRR